MNPIILAIGIVSAIGLLSGLGLAIASIIMAVPADPKTDCIVEVLHGINCGACGYYGCYGYAEALASGETVNTALCAPGSTLVSKEIARLTGLTAGEIIPSAAVVLCQGNTQNTGTKLVYIGAKTCEMANQLFSGQKNCSYGCLGFGDCVDACGYDAIHICEDVARISPLACTACKKCVKACPKGLIEMLPVHEAKAAVLCANKEKGFETRKQCRTGCTGCMKCVQVCPEGAITVTNLCAKVDYEKCTACGKCVAVCPVNSIQIIDLRKFAKKAKV